MSLFDPDGLDGLIREERAAVPPAPPPVPPDVAPASSHRRAWLVTLTVLAVALAMIVVTGLIISGGMVWRGRSAQSVAHEPIPPTGEEQEAHAPPAGSVLATDRSVPDPTPSTPPAGRASDLAPGVEHTLPVAFGVDQLEPQLEPDALASWIEDVQSCERVVLTGHTCALGADEVNELFGKLRADSVRDLLVAGGIQPERIHTRSAGSLLPIADNTTIAGRTANRRVTLSCDTPAQTPRRNP